MTKTIALAISIFTLACVSASGAEQLRIEGAQVRLVAIALPDIKVIAGNTRGAQVAREIIETVRVDLSWSGVFDVLDPRSFTADLSQEGLEKNTIRVDSWRQVGAEALVKMELSLNDDTVSVEMGLHTLLGKKPSGRRSLSGPSSRLRQLSHRISDEIFSFFTGEPGMYNSQIVASRQLRSGKAYVKQIVTLDIDGLNERVLTSGSEPNLIPTYGPEGDTLMFSTYKRYNLNLYQMNLDGGGLKVLSSRFDGNTGAAVSPDRKSIAFTVTTGPSSQIYVADRSGANAKKITDSLGNNLSPSFSPDGSQITFVSTRSGNPQIYVMNSDGSNVKRLTFRGKYNQTPRFSPRGDFIVFMGRDEKNTFDIFLLEVSTGDIRRVTQAAGHNEDPWFSPNGRLILFTSTRDGRREIYVSNLEGTVQRRVTTGGGYFTPAWGPAK